MMTQWPHAGYPGWMTNYNSTCMIIITLNEISFSRRQACSYLRNLDLTSIFTCTLLLSMRWKQKYQIRNWKKYYLTFKQPITSTYWMIIIKWHKISIHKYAYTYVGDSLFNIDAWANEILQGTGIFYRLHFTSQKTGHWAICTCTCTKKNPKCV